MTHTPPSEAAASSPSPFLDQNELQAAADPNCGFTERTRVLAAEVLRMRAQCPSTAEVEQMRADLAQLRQAIGLMATAKPDMLVDVRDPVGMAQQVVAMVGRLQKDCLANFDASNKQKERAEAAEFDRTRHEAERDAFGRDIMAASKALTDAGVEHSTLDSGIRALAGDRDRLRAFAERNGKAATERGDLIEAAAKAVGCKPQDLPKECASREKMLVAFMHAGRLLFGVDIEPQMLALAAEVEEFRSSNLRDACMTFDTFLRRCGIDVTKLEGLMPVPWVIKAAKQLKDAWPRTADPLGTDEARTAVAAIRDLGPELAKAGVTVTPTMTHAEAVAQLRGARDRWRERFEAADKESGATAKRILAMCDLLAEAGFSWTGAESHAAGLRNAVNAALAELARLRKESKRDQVAKQQALLDEIARLFPGKGPLLERVRAAAKPAPSPWRERFMRLRDGIKAQIAWCSLPGGAPFAGMHKEHAVLSCALANADALLVEAAGEGGASWASGLSLFERRSCKEPAAEPAPITDLQYDRASLDAEVDKRGIGSVPATWRENGKQVLGFFGSCKVGPATGQPRTEVPVGPDGSGTILQVVPEGEIRFQLADSGTVVELGEAFREELRQAGPSTIVLDVMFGESTEAAKLRHLHAAVAELAKVVERIATVSASARI